MSAEPFVIPRITTPFDVALALPGSKSIALRQMAIAALTSGESIITGVPPCDDTDAMLDCLRALGVTVAHEDGAFRVTGPMAFEGNVELDARMSGASTRLLIGLAALRSGRTLIDGHHSLRVRTNEPLYELLRRHGCQVTGQAGLPVTIVGPLGVGAGQNAPLVIDGGLSSQYTTALLLIAPLLGGTQRIEITGKLVSRPYIDITLNEMRKRGAVAAWKNERVLEVAPQPYTTGSFDVEGDATAASYFAGLATLHGGRVTLTNLGEQTRQGDYAFNDVMERLGASVTRSAGETVIKGGVLRGLDGIDMTAMPDAGLTLIAMAPLLPNPLTITGLSTLKHKECDRLECPAAEFAKMGIPAQTTADSITVTPTAAVNMTAHELTTYHDHRMAMAFSLLGSVTGTMAVDDPAVVGKTFPGYWEAYARLLSP